MIERWSFEMKYQNIIYLLTMLAIFISGCNVTDSNNFESEYVVESYLFALEPLAELRLSRSASFEQTYIFENQAVSNAVVKIGLLDGNGEVTQSFGYTETTKGVYRAMDSTHMIQPLGTYALEISFPDDDTILRSQTIIPDTFSIVSTNLDTLIYRETDQLEIDVTQSFTPGRQNVFVFSTEAFDVRFDNLTPLFAEFLDEEEDDLEEFRITESPPVNEGNYEINDDSTLTIRLPWLAVVFYGPHRITANAIDDNIFDFVVGLQLQVNPSTLSPGEIPNIVDHIEGGIGIFGSYARIQTDVFVQRN